MNILFLGPPGSGKGTQAQNLSNYLSIPTLSSGDILRKECDSGSLLGKEIQAIMNKGDLVSDDLIVLLIEKFLIRNDSNGFILDGFPRNINQANILDSMLVKIEKSIEKVFNFEVDDEILVKRILGRYSCKECGSIYNNYFKPTVKSGVCDKCGSTNFESRKDDNEESLKNRLSVYHKSTFPLVEFYQKKHLLISIDGLKSSSLIFEELKKHFKL
jgi:adenylate kinase